MKRGEPPRRKTPLKRSGKRIKHRGRPRHADYVANQPYQDFVRGKGCALRYHVKHTCIGSAQFCHVKSRGAGGKDERNGVPLCAVGHDVQGKQGIQHLLNVYKYDMREHAEALWSEWQSE